MAESADNDWSLYPYSPSKPAAMVFAILLTILGVSQIYQSFIRYHWKKFGFMMLWATVCWIAGFVSSHVRREKSQTPLLISHVDLPIHIGLQRPSGQHLHCTGGLCVVSGRLWKNPNTHANWRISIGPPLYAAAEYFILGRLFAYLPYHSPIHPGRVVSTFMLLSVVVESLTANGAANISAASDPSEDADVDKVKRQLQSGLRTMQVSVATDKIVKSIEMLRELLLQAALILQIGVESFFISLVALLQYRCSRTGPVPRRVRPVFLILYVTSAMVVVRCITRAIEAFEMGDCPYGESHSCGYVSSHEWVFYVFECANITLFVILLAIFHPGRYLPRSSRIYLDPVDGTTERVGPGFGKADKRPLWATFLDPFVSSQLFLTIRLHCFGTENTFLRISQPYVPAKAWPSKVSGRSNNRYILVGQSATMRCRSGTGVSSKIWVMGKSRFNIEARQCSSAICYWRTTLWPERPFLS